MRVLKVVKTTGGRERGRMGMEVEPMEPPPAPLSKSISVTKSCWTIACRETASLLDQLETVRKEKHEVEEARAMAAKQRVQQIEELVSENGNLREEVRVLNERLKTQADELGQVRKEMSLVESSLFRANSEVSNDCQYTYQGFAKLLHGIRSPRAR